MDLGMHTFNIEFFLLVPQIDFTKFFFNLGFALRKVFEQHMNIHTGAKPFRCDYCGRGFSGDGNRRMHQKTTHEGFKRGFK